MVGCLTLATFWTFPLSKTRITLGLTNLLILTVMLIYLRSRLPMSGTQLPLIGEKNVWKWVMQMFTCLSLLFSHFYWFISNHGDNSDTNVHVPGQLGLEERWTPKLFDWSIGRNSGKDFVPFRCTIDWAGILQAIYYKTDKRQRNVGFHYFIWHIFFCLDSYNPQLYNWHGS